MRHPLDLPLVDIAAALHRADVSAEELTEEAIRRYEREGERHHAYKLFDADGARAAARRADSMLAAGSAPPLCGLPYSAKDLYGVDGLPTFAGTARRLPERWSRDAWLVARLREQGAVLMGKTHTVELAYGGVGINPHWGTPRNPWDADVHRIPGGSSCGAGVSLWEGSAVVALGSDTGGSIRIPASMTGVVGHRGTRGRWPTDGVVPLSGTLDTVGALTRTAADAAYFFGSIDPAWGDPAAFLAEAERLASGPIRVGMPGCEIWEDCQRDIAAVLDGALARLCASGWERVEVDGGVLDEASDLYAHGGIARTECLSFLERDLPGWIDLLHPTVGERLASGAPPDADRYRAALDLRARLVDRAAPLFGQVDVIALPTAIVTPPPVAELDDMGRYLEINLATLRPTAPASILGLCAVSLPAGVDAVGMPVGLQLLAPGGHDERALGVAMRAETALGLAQAPHDRGRSS